MPGNPNTCLFLGPRYAPSLGRAIIDAAVFPQARATTTPGDRPPGHRRVRSGLSIPCTLHTFISTGSSPRPRALLHPPRLAATVSGRSRTPGTDRFMGGASIWCYRRATGRSRAPGTARFTYISRWGTYAVSHMPGQNALPLLWQDYSGV